MNILLTAFRGWRTECTYIVYNVHVTYACNYVESVRPYDMSYGSETLHWGLSQIVSTGENSFFRWKPPIKDFPHHL